MIIWLGDLNYRLVAEMDMTRTLEMIEANQLADLADWDQLNRERDANRVFQK